MAGYNSGAFLELNLANISTDISDWPDGPYFARVSKAENAISSAGNPMIALWFELHDENYGSGTVRDWLTVNSDFGQRKAKQLVMAVNDITPEGMADFVAEHPTFRLEPEAFLNQELIVFLGKQPGRDGTGMFANVVAPFYAPLSQADTLLGD